jgi:hypothetical protein
MSDLKHHWLVAGNVVATGANGQTGQRGLNTLVVTSEAIFTRTDIATAQEGLMRRFLNETEQAAGAKITDVFVISVSRLGEMTHEEFEGAFAEEAAVAAAGIQ